MTVKILIGDCREMLQTLPDESVHCCVTSPPYFGLRDYGHDSQIGLEPTPGEFVQAIVEVFREVRRVLRADGTVWLNLGDSYARDTGKGQHKPGDAGKQNYVIERGNGRASAMIDLKSESRGSSDGAVGRADRAAVPNGGSGLKAKDLIGIPWRVAFGLQADGWYLRQDIIWAKPNPMPESVTDRCTKSHEYLFLLSKSERYYFDAASIAEAVAPATVSRLAQDVENQIGSNRVPGKTNGTMKAVKDKPGKRAQAGYPGQKAHAGTLGVTPDVRNKRSVWTIATQPFSEAHFATFPPKLIEPCILAGCPVGGTILDPFGGAGTTALVSENRGRNSILIELNPEYAAMADNRIRAALGRVEGAPLQQSDLPPLLQAMEAAE